MSASLHPRPYTINYAWSYDGAHWQHDQEHGRFARIDTAEAAARARLVHLIDVRRATAAKVNIFNRTTGLTEKTLTNVRWPS